MNVLGMMVAVPATIEVRLRQLQFNRPRHVQLAFLLLVLSRSTHGEVFVVPWGLLGRWLRRSRLNVGVDPRV